MTINSPVNLALIGAGRIGSFHAETVAKRLTNANLYAVADPVPGAAENLAEKLGAGKACLDYHELLADPDVDGVIITTPARFHTEIAVAAAQAGKAVFCEKPMGLTLEDTDKVVEIAAETGVPIQVGFNRRWDLSFADGRAAIEDGKIGTPQLIRSVIRDPGPFSADPAKIPPWTIFYETLIHDFDTILWLNAGSKPVSVYAVADALVRPDAKGNGFLDTAVVTIRFDNGAIAVAEANFSALYGYDIRGEVFGSEGMVKMGNPRRSDMQLFTSGGASQQTWRQDTDRFLHGYTAQLRAFADAVRSGAVNGPTPEDARGALELALASIQSVQEERAVKIAD